jgi:hypothetical protein
MFPGRCEQSAHKTIYSVCFRGKSTKTTRFAEASGGREAQMARRGGENKINQVVVIWISGDAASKTKPQSAFRREQL